MRFLLKITYDGSNYAGYQEQPYEDTIEKRLKEALQIVNAGHKTNIVASGRTDKGVHALSQMAHTDLSINITPYKLKRALNSNLPNDIHIISTKVVSSNFHARYNVKSKEYKYYLNMGEYDPINRNYIYQYNYTLNVSKMQEAIKYFLGEHDFRAFVTENKDKTNCIRTITKVSITKKKNTLCFTFKGTGFLRYQVRNMVGILLQVGQEKIPPAKVLAILNSKDRTKFGKTAPAVGLYLTKVSYHN